MTSPVEMEDDDDVARRQRASRFTERVHAELDLDGRWVTSICGGGDDPIDLDGGFSPEELETIARIWRETENE